MDSTGTTLGAWHMIQRQSADGAVEFQWKSWSRYTVDDTTESIQAPGVSDVDHMNALSLDPTDGAYIVSLRNLDAVRRRSTTTRATCSGSSAACSRR